MRVNTDTDTDGVAMAELAREPGSSRNKVTDKLDHRVPRISRDPMRRSSGRPGSE